MTQEEHLEYSHQASNSGCDQVNDDSAKSKNICTVNQVDSVKSSAISKAREADNLVAGVVLDINDNILDEIRRVVNGPNKSELKGSDLKGASFDMTVFTHQSSSENIRDIQTKIEKPEKNIENENASVKDVSDNHEAKASDVKFAPEGATCDSNLIPVNSNNVVENKTQNEVEGRISTTLPDKSPDNISDHHKRPEDPIARLDALRANISNVLKEVKAVLTQHGEQTNEQGKEEVKPIEDNVVRFRFVKRIRKKSIVDLEGEEKQANENEEKQKCEDSSQENIAGTVESQQLKVSDIKDEELLRENQANKPEDPTQKELAEVTKETPKTDDIDLSKDKAITEENKANNYTTKATENEDVVQKIKNEENANGNIVKRRKSIGDQKGTDKEKTEESKVKTKAEITRKNIPKEKVSKSKTNGESSKRVRRGSKDMTKASSKPQIEKLPDSNNVNKRKKSIEKPEIPIIEPSSNKKDLVPPPSIELVPVPSKEIVLAPKKGIVIAENALVSKSINIKTQVDDERYTEESKQRIPEGGDEDKAGVLKTVSGEKSLHVQQSIEIEINKSEAVANKENKTTEVVNPASTVKEKKNRTGSISALEKVLATTNLKLNNDILPLGKILTGKLNRSKSPSPEYVSTEGKSPTPTEVRDQPNQEKQLSQKSTSDGPIESKRGTQPTVIDEQKEQQPETSSSKNSKLKILLQREKSASIAEGDKIKKIFKFVQTKSTPTAQSETRRHSMPPSLLNITLKTKLVPESFIPIKKLKDAEEKKSDQNSSVQKPVQIDKESVPTRNKTEVVQNLLAGQKADQQKPTPQSPTLTSDNFSLEPSAESKTIPLVQLPVKIESSQATTVSLKPQLVKLPSPNKAVQSEATVVEVKPIETTFSETASKPPQGPVKEKLELEKTDAATNEQSASKEEEVKDQSQAENKSDEVENESKEQKKSIPKKRKMKKKVVIRRIKRKLSLENAAPPEPVEPEICEKEIEPEAKPPEPEEEELPSKPRSCLKFREYQPGEVVMYADRIKKTVKWKKATIMERVTSISYKLNVDGEEKSAHICYIKKFTDKKVHFGAKEYLEIDYAQEESEDEEDEKRPYSIWAVS